MTKQELTDWALANGWKMVAGMPSLMKPSARNEAIVRLALKATVVVVEVKKPAGKWEKFASESYAKVQARSRRSGHPLGLGFESHPRLRHADAREQGPCRVRRRRLGRQGLKGRTS